MATKLSILVFRGDPVDLAQYRHTALLFEFGDRSTSLMQITGAHGFFRFQADSKPDFRHIGGLQRKIPVATAAALPASTTASAAAARIRMAVASTRVRNALSDADWDCQHWTGDALRELQAMGWLEEAQRLEAIDVMAGVILEAKDEP